MTLEQINKIIGRNRRRIWISGTIRMLILSAFPGCIASAIWLLALTAVDQPQIAALWPVILLLFIAIACGISAFDSVSERLSAFVTDQTLELKQRLLTWQELKGTPASDTPAFYALQNDLMKVLDKRGIQPNQAKVEIHLPRELRYLPLPAAVLLLAVVWPAKDADVSSRQQQAIVLDEQDLMQSQAADINMNGEQILVRSGSITMSAPKELLPMDTSLQSSRNIVTVTRHSKKNGRDESESDGVSSERSDKLGDQESGHAASASANASTDPGEIQFAGSSAPAQQAILDRTFRSQVERYPEVALALVRYRKQLAKKIE